MSGMSSVPLIMSVLFAGFMGSWHCALMCGPICVSLSSRGSLWSYHAGRGLSYTLFGAFAGAIGSAVLLHSNIIIKIMGALVLVGILLWLTVHQWKAEVFPWQQWMWQKINRYRNPSKFVLGISSVFLPCAWLYYFMAAAAATQSPWTGSLVLFLFWLSSLPALAGASLIMRGAVQKAPLQKRRVATLVITLSGMYAIAAHFF